MSPAGSFSSSSTLLLFELGFFIGKSLVAIFLWVKFLVWDRELWECELCFIWRRFKVYLPPPCFPTSPPPPAAGGSINFAYSAVNLPYNSSTVVFNMASLLTSLFLILSTITCLSPTVNPRVCKSVVILTRCLIIIILL